VAGRCRVTPEGPVVLIKVVVMMVVMVVTVR